MTVNEEIGGVGLWREWMEGVKWEDGGLMREKGMSGVGLIEGRNGCGCGWAGVL